MDRKGTGYHKINDLTAFLRLGNSTMYFLQNKRISAKNKTYFFLTAYISMLVWKTLSSILTWTDTLAENLIMYSVDISFHVLCIIYSTFKRISTE